MFEFYNISKYIICQTTRYYDPLCCVSVLCSISLNFSTTSFWHRPVFGYDLNWNCLSLWIQYEVRNHHLHITCNTRVTWLSNNIKHHVPYYFVTILSRWCSFVKKETHKSIFFFGSLHYIDNGRLHSIAVVRTNNARQTKLMFILTYKSRYVHVSAV